MALGTVSAGGATGPMTLNMAVVDFCRRRTTLTKTEAHVATTKDRRGASALRSVAEGLAAAAASMDAPPSAFNDTVTGGRKDGRARGRGHGGQQLPEHRSPTKHTWKPLF